MRQGIHPQFNTDTAVVCSCGNTFTTGSTKASIRVDLCSNCHPFYTGTQKLVDTEGKVEKFARQRKVAEERKKTVAAKQTTVREERPNSLADMIATIRKQQKSS